MGRNT